MLFRLGEVDFDFTKSPLESLEQSISGAWQVRDLIATKPNLFKLKGQTGLSELRLKGTLVMQNKDTRERLAKMVHSNNAYELIGGDGSIWGRYAIKSASFSLKQPDHLGLPRIQEITVELIEHD